MPRASAAAENAALNGLDGTGSTNVIPFSSLHTGDPGTTGATESASTTRQATTWNAASGGAKTNRGAVTWTTPGSTACTYFGTWSLVSAGVYAIGGALGSSVTAVTIVAAAGALSIGAS